MGLGLGLRLGEGRTEEVLQILKDIFLRRRERARLGVSFKRVGHGGGAAVSVRSVRSPRGLAGSGKLQAYSTSLKGVL